MLRQIRPDPRCLYARIAPLLEKGLEYAIQQIDGSEVLLVMSDSISFGQTISRRRKEKEMSQKELAAKIKREDGESISPQYLNDIEHDRRSPSSDLMVQQFAKVLGLDADYLYYLAGRIPTDIINKNLPPEKVQRLMVAFRQQIKSEKK